jgi:glyoxylase-like metal-dependent hydrolase (beta-lactamase superfamily II)
LANPGKLMESAKRIYQDDMDRLWGQMHPIPAEQIRAVADREVLDFGDVQIVAHHTPGHAVHHVAWELGVALFTGDVAGVKIANGPVVPPCPPPDIHLADWQASIARMRQIAPHILYLTHYGAIVDPMAHLSELETRLHAYANWMKVPFDLGEAAEAVTPRFVEFVHADLRTHGVPESDLPVYDAANPPWMSVAGLLRFWRKQTSQ